MISSLHFILEGLKSYGFLLIFQNKMEYLLKEYLKNYKNTGIFKIIYKIHNVLG